MHSLLLYVTHVGITKIYIILSGNLILYVILQTTDNFNFKIYTKNKTTKLLNKKHTTIIIEQNKLYARIVSFSFDIIETKCVITFWRSVIFLLFSFLARFGIGLIFGIDLC